MTPNYSIEFDVEVTFATADDASSAAESLAQETSSETFASFVATAIEGTALEGQSMTIIVQVSYGSCSNDYGTECNSDGTIGSCASGCCVCGLCNEECNALAEDGAKGGDGTTVIVIVGIVVAAVVLAAAIIMSNAYVLLRIAEKQRVVPSGNRDDDDNVPCAQIVDADNTKDTISSRPLSHVVVEHEDSFHAHAQDDTSLILLQSGLNLETVDGLSALPPTWRNCLLPRDQEDAVAMRTTLATLLDDVQNTSSTCEDKILKTRFDDIVVRLKPLFTRRIEMYEKALGPFGSVACDQVCCLLDHLEGIYKEAYEGVFKLLALKEGNELKKWSQFATSEKLHLKTQRRIRQASVVLSENYLHGASVRKAYDRYLARVAAKTGGVYTKVSMKRIFRAIEKSAFRHKREVRFHSDTVCDIVRGAIVYDTIAGIHAGAKMIFSEDTIVCTRIKDRFTPGLETNGGWRDCMINVSLFRRNVGTRLIPLALTNASTRTRHDQQGYMRDDLVNKHQVEIQLHLSELLKFRSMGDRAGGGHRLYATFRALQEALEVTYGSDIADKIKQRARIRAKQREHVAVSPHPRPLPKEPRPARPPPRQPPPPKLKVGGSEDVNAKRKGSVDEGKGRWVERETVDTTESGRWGR